MNWIEPNLGPRIFKLASVLTLLIQGTDVTADVPKQPRERYQKQGAKGSLNGKAKTT